MMRVSVETTKLNQLTELKNAQIHSHPFSHSFDEEETDEGFNF